MKKFLSIMANTFVAAVNIVLIIMCVMLIAATVAGCAISQSLASGDSKLVKLDESLFEINTNNSVTKLFYFEFTDREKREGVALEYPEKINGDRKFIYKSYNEIPEDLKNAFIAIEDKRFSDHNGVDIFRSAAAAIEYIKHPNSRSFGASTITQQLIKNVTGNDSYSVSRKLNEIFSAIQLEKIKDKTEILEQYLNIINLSHGICGVGAAAEYYFSKDVSELTLEEAASIAAITNSPSYYDPQTHPENNRKRRDLILSEMYSQGYISYVEYTEAIGNPVNVNISDSGSEENRKSSWYADMVINDVIRDLSEKYGISKSAASLKVYNEGLSIYMAIDPEVQSEIDRYYSDTSNFPVHSGGRQAQCSMIIIDPKTGDILGVAGAIGKKSGNRVQNFATDTKRPSGSSIKPLSVYAPAIDRRMITWASVYDDTPVNFNGGASYTNLPWPRNANLTYQGLMNINKAIINSTNTVAIKVLDDLGYENSYDFLTKKLHFSTLVPPGENDSGDANRVSLALGQQRNGVTLREISGAYSMLANGGVFNSTRSYFLVCDSDGNILLSNNYNGERVISEEAAFVTTKMLCNVVNYGLSSDMKLASMTETAGKSGTTNSSCDRWFIGYTDSYICGVWYGFEYPEEIKLNYNPSAEAFDAVLSSIYTKLGKTFGSFEMPDGVTVRSYCKDSGKCECELCRLDPRGSRLEYGYFISGTEPTGNCDRHVLVPYDNEHGGVICSDEFYEDQIRYISLVKINRAFPIEIEITDAQYSFRTLPEGAVIPSSPYIPYYALTLPFGMYPGVSDGGIQFNRAAVFLPRKEEETEEVTGENMTSESESVTIPE